MAQNIHAETDLRCGFFNPQHVDFYAVFSVALPQIFPIELNKEVKIHGKTQDF